jgi:hypothetical protein
LFLNLRLLLLSTFAAKRRQLKYKGSQSLQPHRERKAKCNDAGFGYVIVQCLLAAIRNHEPFRTSFGLKGFYYCVLHFRKITNSFITAPRARGTQSH